MGTFLMAKAIPPFDFVMVLELSATGVQHWPLQANTQATSFIYSPLKVCNHIKSFQM